MLFSGRLGQGELLAEEKGRSVAALVDLPERSPQGRAGGYLKQAIIGS